jgi:hypothetical protein
MELQMKYIFIFFVFLYTLSVPTKNFAQKVTELSNTATQLCTENAPAGTVNPNFALLTGLNENQNAGTVKKYIALLNSQPEKFKSQLATINTLKASQIKVYFNFVSKKLDDNGTEGFTEPLFANNVLITISDNERSRLDLNGKIAHELEHARQIAAGELAYSGICDRSEKVIKIRWIPNAYDVTDEIKAYAAQIAVAPAVSDCELISIFRTAKTEAAQEKVLSKYFPNIEHSPKTNDFIAAGEIVLPKFKRLYLAIGTKK